VPLRRSAVGIALVAVAALFGSVLEQVASGGPLADADRAALRWIIDHRVSFVTDVCRGVTVLGDGWVVGPIVAAAVLLLAWRRWRLGALVASTAIVTSLLTTLTKSLVGRPRPPVHVRLVSVSGPAFPSGHASIAVACYLTLAAVLWATSPPGWRRITAGAAAILVTLAIGCSRVYLGVHWPSDVLGGWLLGAGVLLALVGGGARWAGTPSAS
jgi:membrane-associated phospholipid phosphatase